MPDLKLSVVVPTRDRPDKLRSTVSGLLAQRDLDPEEFELIVVDDGSRTPATSRGAEEGPVVRVIRLEGKGPSAARNRGATEAGGELLVFVDDDIGVVPEFLASHWRAHLEWPGALQVGSIRLPESAIGTPFGRFRQDLEDNGVPIIRGVSETSNFCTAANMAIEREVFAGLGGFDSTLGSGEDQDLAMRHAKTGGQIVFLPEAKGTHNDDALQLEAYCTRFERYSEDLVRFGALHPELSATAERARVNGPIEVGREPLGASAKKLMKRALLLPPMHSLMLGLVAVIERVAPKSGLLDRLYRTHLGAHLLRGYRRGLQRGDV